MRAIELTNKSSMSINIIGLVLLNICYNPHTTNLIMSDLTIIFLQSRIKHKQFTVDFILNKIS